jgi:hypothetical protein
MNTRNEASQTNDVANPSKRTRQTSLLSNGTNLGTTLLVPAAFLEPKMPPFRGE